MCINKFWKLDLIQCNGNQHSSIVYLFLDSQWRSSLMVLTLVIVHFRDEALVEYRQYRVTFPAWEQKNVCCFRHKIIATQCIVIVTAIP